MQELLKKLNKINIKIDLVDEKLDIQAPKGVMTEDLLNEIKLYKNDLIEFISQHKSKKEKHTFIPKVEEQSCYILSSSQKRLWLLSQFENGNLAYNMTSVFKLKGNVNFSALEKAFMSLIDRHESLRTIFKQDEFGEVKQFILTLEENKFQLQFEDVSQKENITGIVKDIISAETNYSFDLSFDSLVRAKLIKTSEDTFVFVCVMHHIISDGQSSELMSKELFTLYDSFVKGNGNPLPILPIQYKDYAAWQQEIIKNKEFESHKSYWLQKFDGEIPVLDLPTYQIRTVVKTYNGKQINRIFSKKLSKDFNDLCKSQGSTLFMGLLAVAKSLLYRYTHQTDIVIGSPIAGREHADLQNQIGFYVNTLALRTQFTGKDTFNELLSKVKEVTLDAYKHQNYPFDELVASLPLERNQSRNPLFDVMVTYQNEDNLKTGVQIVDNIEIKRFQSEDETLSKFDMDFVFSETLNGIELGLTYNTDLYTEEFIVKFLNHFNYLLQEITITPEKVLADLEFLSSEEKQQLLFGFNKTVVEYKTDKTIIDLFEEQVAKTPNNIAISFEEKSLTYQELNQKANQLASFLRENYTVKSDDLIGIVLDRSTNLITSILGVLKSGAAYVPIDRNYPQERIDFIIADSNCKFTIDDNFFNLFNVVTYSKEDLDRVNSTNDLAYVIYTSGTTGEPKGVMVEHRNLVNLCYWHASSFEVDANSRGTLFSGVGFDASVWEIFPYLINGSSLYPIKNDEIRLNINEFSNFIKNNKISHCYLPSAICNEVANSEIDFNNVKFLTGGEALKIDTPSNIEIYNNYGPTENTIVSTFYKIKPNEIGNISIGRPISNTQIYILDEEFNIVPIGVSGKLYISGAGLTRGYLNKPELTAEKFLDNPFENGTKMYDTGDLGRWLPDGNIEFLGRKDFQVKIRGYRVELGEIETVVSQYSDNIKQVVADVKKVSGENVLACYYTVASETEIDKIHLRKFLQTKLPEYMVPSFFVELEAIPLTPNGKIDRSALPSVTGEDLIRREYIAPKNETEQKLVEIWQEVLGLEQVGITDNFFELGGHSLVIGNILSNIREIYNINISYKDFYLRTSIDKLSNFISEELSNEVYFEVLCTGMNYSSMRSHYGDGEVIFNFMCYLKFKNIGIEYINKKIIIKRNSSKIDEDIKEFLITNKYLILEFLKEDFDDSKFFKKSKSSFLQNEVYKFIISNGFNSNINFGIVINKKLDLSKLEKSINNLIQEHKILKTSFFIENDYLYQKVNSDCRIFKINYEEFENFEEADSYCKSETLKNIDIFNDNYLMSAHLLKFNKSSFILFFVVNHIIFDGFSINIFFKDLFNFYFHDSFSSSKIHFIQYTRALEFYETTSNFSKDKFFWENKFNKPFNKGFFDNPIYINKNSDIEFNFSNTLTIKIEIKNQVSKKIIQFCKKNSFGLNDFFLGIYYLLINKLSGNEDVLIDCTISNRENGDVFDEIGLFTNSIFLRLNTSEVDFSKILKYVSIEFMDSLSHNGYSSNRVYNELGLNKYGHQLLRKFKYNYLNNNGLNIYEKNIDIVPYSIFKNTGCYYILLQPNYIESTISFDLIFNKTYFTDDDSKFIVNAFNDIINNIIK